MKVHVLLLLLAVVVGCGSQALAQSANCNITVNPSNGWDPVFNNFGKVQYGHAMVQVLRSKGYTPTQHDGALSVESEIDRDENTIYLKIIDQKDRYSSRNQIITVKHHIPGSSYCKNNYNRVRCNEAAEDRAVDAAAVKLIKASLKNLQLCSGL